MREKAGSKACEPCHAPLAALVQPGEPVIEEGVTCEACHAIREASEGPAGVEYAYALAENRKFGPICDAKDNYFHRMGCSPLHREARFCGGCHAWTMDAKAGAKLAVFTDYPEWKATSYAQAGIACQDCHMPTTTAQVASGAERKVRVGNHGFLAGGGERARHALGLVAKASDLDGRIALEVSLKNEGAGHAVPAGMPGRQVIVRVRVLDAAGNEGAHEERALGRVLGDEAGREVPFYAAQKEQADERIKPGETRKLDFTLEAPSEGTVEVAVAWRSASPAIVAATGVPAEERPMTEAKIPFGARQKGAGRALLPKTVMVRP
ncbi:hypothetical protein E8A73_002190 [Polyangium aurulentum]|nr:hypothetical protein E8A73_002190 [Polyangium aurulentum]